MTTQAMNLGDILWKLEALAESGVVDQSNRTAAREATRALREFNRALLGDIAQPVDALTGKLNTYVENLFEADAIRAAQAAALEQRDELLTLANCTIPSDWVSVKATEFRTGYDNLLAGKPAYWSPHYFKKGEKVMYGEFQAFVENHYSEGMWNIRLPGGPSCVTGADLKRV